MMAQRVCARGFRHPSKMPTEAGLLACPSQSTKGSMPTHRRPSKLKDGETDPMITRNLLAGMCLGMILTLAGCQKKTAEEGESAPPAEEPRKPVVQSAPDAPALPTPARVPAVAAATPEPPQLAPPGTFFLLAKVSVESSEGIVGILPGTELHAVSPGIYEDGQKNRLTLRDDQVTNDLRRARQARGTDASSQAAIARSAQIRQQAEHARQMQKPAEAAATASTAPPPSALPAATPAPLGSSLGTAPIGTTHDATKGKIYHNSSGVPYWKDAKGRVRYDF